MIEDFVANLSPLFSAVALRGLTITPDLHLLAKDNEAVEVFRKMIHSHRSKFVDGGKEYDALAAERRVCAGGPSEPPLTNLLKMVQNHQAHFSPAAQKGLKTISDALNEEFS